MSDWSAFEDVAEEKPQAEAKPEAVSEPTLPMGDAPEEIDLKHIEHLADEVLEADEQYRTYADYRKVVRARLAAAIPFEQRPLLDTGKYKIKVTEKVRIAWDKDRLAQIMAAEGRGLGDYPPFVKASLRVSNAAFEDAEPALIEKYEPARDVKGAGTDVSVELSAATGTLV